MNKNRMRNWIRPMIQISFFIIVMLISIAKALSDEGMTVPFITNASLHAICPFGGVVSIYTYLTDGILIQKIHSSSIILMYAVFFMTLLFGPVFCGWICPFGTFQEFIGKIGKKIFGKRYNHFLPKRLDSILRYLRYFVLILVIYNTAASAKLIFQNVDPYYALFNLFTSEVAVAAYIILAITVIASLFVERPFCKYICPYGATLGIFNLFRIFKIKRNQKTCISCDACNSSCPMNIEVSSSNTIYNHQCISCLKCTSENACPIKDTVILRIGGGKNEN
ncbi:4Fe-4S binding protein [[Clostridium] fimetarium]|uniref:4Fe-4S binding domain-containing protein n=1 Tax=[Clostridium] fimetarium TaxID=99656 RepID=A0A1I0RVI6_9FIRM|nr:4Fe-4S binding protein [[Clostridium] fimetarium]SEW44812.1 4Fe-4S binding domain-containing protein [[Clostridium] fimetarium]